MGNANQAFMYLGYSQAWGSEIYFQMSTQNSMHSLFAKKGEGFIPINGNTERALKKGSLEKRAYEGVK